MAKAKTSRDVSLMALIGTAIGCLWIISPGGLLMLTLVAFSGVVLWRFSSPEDRKFIMTIFIIGLTSRIIVYLILGFISILAGKSGWLAGDSWGIYNYAWAWAQQVDGPPDVIYMQAMDGHLYTYPNYPIKEVWQYGYSGFTYLLGAIFYFFGPLKFSPRILNCLMGVGAGVLIYYIVKDIFGKKPAKLSAVLTIFTPSLFLWSMTYMKDIPFVFAGCVLLWSFQRFQKTKKAIYPFVFFIVIFAQYTIRPKFPILIIASCFILTYFIVSGISWKTKIIAALCLLILIMPLVHEIDFKKKVDNKLTHILRYSRGVMRTGGSTYNVFDEKYYPGGSLARSDTLSYFDFIKGYFKGWFYLLSVPFPWKTHTQLLLMSYPQVILWYLLIPFVLIGMGTALRYKWRETLVIFVYIIIIGSIIATSSGNIGTAFRHRDMLTPLFLIFASVGLIKTLGHLNNLRSSVKEHL